MKARQRCGSRRTAGFRSLSGCRRRAGLDDHLAQIAAEALGVPVDRIDVVMADTGRTPPAHVTAGSSTTITTGAAVKLAAEDAKRQLLALVDGLPQAFDPGSPPSGRDDIVGIARVTSGSNAYLTNAFAAHFAEVEVDMRNGRIRVLRYVAAHDSGRIVHPAWRRIRFRVACYNFSASPCVRNCTWTSTVG